MEPSSSSSQPKPKTAKPAWQVFAVFFAVTAVAAVVGGMFLPGAWYQDLAKPTFNPPNWLFAPVWLVLYITIAISGALAWRAGANRWVVGWWALQIALNAAWTALFFGLQKPGLALIEILALLAAIVMYARVVWPVERRSSLLLIPYVLWVAFAAMLNLMIWHLNG